MHLPGRPTTLCTLRALTGVPCPLCGGTTAAVHLGRADLAGALRASPLAVFGAFAFVLGPVTRLLRTSRTQPRPRPSVWTRPWPKVWLWTAIGAVAVASELWQLHRFGYL